MKKITQTYKIHAPIDRVWQALINPELIDAWGGGPAKMSPKEGEDFSLWGGSIHGTNLKVVRPSLLRQDWYGEENWTTPSKVTFKLTTDNSETMVDLIQDLVPDEDAVAIADGWKTYYLGPLKEFVEAEYK